MTPAPLSVRVARVLAVPPPLLAYFLIRVPQVSTGEYVPWSEAVVATLIVAVLVPMWLYWVADLILWKRDRPTPLGEPSPLELTADLSDHGVFEGDLRALVDAEAHGRAIPLRYVMPDEGRRPEGWFQGRIVVTEPNTDDRPTEPLLLTHEFTPASGIRMELFHELEREVVGRHRKPDAPQPIPPPTDVNVLPYAFLNRTRELPF